MSELATYEFGQEAIAGRRPLRIALLGYRSNPFSGGQGVYLKFLSRALVDAGHQVDVISGEPYPELDQRVGLVKLPGLNLFEEPNHVTALRPRHLLSATDFFEWFSMLSGGFPEPYTFGRRLTRLFGGISDRYDVVHDNQSLCYGLLDVARQTPVFCTIHHPITWDRDIAVANAATRGERLLIRRWHSFLTMQTRVAKRLSRIVTVSERSKRDICAAFEIPAARVTVVRNGIDTEAFRPDPAVVRKPWQLVTTASADQPLKGAQHLLPAFADLCRRFPELRLVFIGAPRPGGKTDRMVDALGVRHRIDFIHGISTTDIRRLYAESTVAVVPSEYEGFGLPAGEAMACGTPLVSTDGGALPEVVGQAGRIVPSRDPDALASAIAGLLVDRDERERLGRVGRARMVEHFSWAEAAQKLTTLYEQALP
ncbi:MAG: glycosyltransferase [Pseudomonadales bacterium]|nr:glycosyltransferase family 4 protein [Pseudomonadales bacterium]NIX09847.1 glycosyltransferase [Pseudomonadales bacterium]